MSGPTEKPPVILGSSCAVWDDDRVLLILRKNPPQVWSLPGGRVEPGEMVADAAVREIAEETRLSIEAPRFVGLIEAINLQVKPAHHFVIAVHATQNFTGHVVASDDAADACWVRLDEVEALRTTDRLKPMLERSFDLLKG